MKLSPHFSLSEFTRSQTAARRGMNNTPNATQIQNLRTLCENVLEPIRAHFEVPIVISSGFRSPALNEAIGGSDSSQHSRGEAADFTVAHYSVTEIFNWLAFTSGLEFDQLIHEHERWIHISFTRRRANRQSVLKAHREGGQTTYLMVHERLNV